MCVYDNGYCLSVTTVLLFHFYVQSISMVGHPNVLVWMIISNNALHKKSLHCHCDHVFDYWYTKVSNFVKNNSTQDGQYFILSQTICFKSYNSGMYHDKFGRNYIMPFVMLCLAFKHNLTDFLPYSEKLWQGRTLVNLKWFIKVLPIQIDTFTKICSNTITGKKD